MQAVQHNGLPLLPQGRTVGEAVRPTGVTQFTYYRWRKAVSDLTLEKLILKEAASGNF